MIISHKHKFIFIKTKKTAGTSVEIALSKFCGESDVITPISPKDEAIRAQFGYRGPQNHLIPFWKYSVRDWAKFLRKRKRRFLYPHSGARDVQQVVGDEVWNSYFRFCFERNPWDKVISLYFWRHKSEPRPPISEFIQSGKANLVGGPGGFDLYSINGEIVVDRVCLYENLEQEIEYLAQRLNLPEIPQLPRAKAEFRKDKRHYQAILSEEDRIKISRVFAREIAYFGYMF
jgi:hypothetical protein